MALGYAIFEVYLAREWDNIKAGKEIVVEVHSRDDGSTHLVKAKIAKSKEKLPDGEALWVKNEDGGFLAENPWAIKILEELDPDEVSFPPAARSTKIIYGVGG
jgi:hypothetical protein